MARGCEMFPERTAELQATHGRVPLSCSCPLKFSRRCLFLIVFVFFGVNLHLDLVLGPLGTLGLLLGEAPLLAAAHALRLRILLLLK